MCSSCDYDSAHCEIFWDDMTDSWFLDVATNEYDSCDGGFIHQRYYLNYCPQCGRKLPEGGID